jgi:hypothetical protein
MTNDRLTSTPCARVSSDGARRADPASSFPAAGIVSIGGGAMRLTALFIAGSRNTAAFWQWPLSKLGASVPGKSCGRLLPD